MVARLLVTYNGLQVEAGLELALSFSQLRVRSSFVSKHRAA